MTATMTLSIEGMQQQQNGIRVTRIGRIFTDYLIHSQHEKLCSCVNKISYGINNELGRTETNSGNLVCQYYSINVIKEVRI
jgi:hypothetical protein